MSQIIMNIGTSGFSYTDWIGPFYPQGLKKSDFLGWYAREFNFVELNFSYYSLPTAKGSAGMIAQTPAGFMFSIKAHSSLTHQIIPHELPDRILQFKTGIEPLQNEKRLAGVLFQFPYSFHYTKDNRLHLALICREFADTPIFVEFRNAEWEQPRVMDGLAGSKAVMVSTDSPDLRGLPSNIYRPAANTLYIRFHGRNKEMWWKGDNATRYDYDYSPAELNEAADLIKTVLKQGGVLYTAFNNHLRGQAPRNAAALRKTLSEGA